MERKRVIDPKFWTDDKIIELESEQKLLYLGMMNHSDDRGIHKNNPKVLKAEIFPAEDNITSQLVEEYIKVLLTSQLLLISKDGRLLRFANWDIYQKIQHKTKSRYEDDDGNIIIPFIYKYNTSSVEVSHNIININKDNINNISSDSIKKDTTTFNPKPYKKRVEEWYDEFLKDDVKLKRFNDTFPDIDVKQKLGECYVWLLENVRKNKDKTFFNWCSSHSGKVNNKKHSNEVSYKDFQLDTTGNARIGYCVECYRSDFYDIYKIHEIDSKCCGKQLLPNKEMCNAKQTKD